MSPRAREPAAAPSRRRRADAQLPDAGDPLQTFNDLAIWLNTNAGTNLPTLDTLTGPLAQLWRAALSDTTPPVRGVPWRSTLELAWHPVPPGPFTLHCIAEVRLAQELLDAGRRRRR